MLKDLAREKTKYMDHLAILNDKHRINPNDPGFDITKTAFFDLGVELIKKAYHKK